MSSPRKVYWDTSCFICFLNKQETTRRLICEDVLSHAQSGEVELWTSTWTVVEVIRPRRTTPIVPSLPEWTAKVPDARSQIQQIWDYYYRNTAPFERLTDQQISKVDGMFKWGWLHKIIVDERTASKAVELCRTRGLKPADSVHAASAILKRVDALQRWDRDFNKVKDIIAIEEPQRLSRQDLLIPDIRRIGPAPDDD